MTFEIKPKSVAGDWECYADEQGRNVTRHKATCGEVVGGKGGWYWRQAGCDWSSIPCGLGKAMDEAIDPYSGIEFLDAQGF